MLNSTKSVLDKLKAKARSDQLAGMARYGIKTEHRLGVQVPEMRRIAKETGKNHELALELWRTGIADARIVAAMVDEPEKLTEFQMEDWVKEIDSWDIGDQVCMNLFEKNPLAWKKIVDWSKREEEFVKRTAFGLLACLAWHDKTAGNEKFIDLFPVISYGALDERRSIKKAVSWALRNIGKRNVTLNEEALKLAQEIRKSGNKAAKWVSSEVTRELQSEAVQKRLKKNKIKETP